MANRAISISAFTYSMAFTFAAFIFQIQVDNS